MKKVLKSVWKWLLLVFISFSVIFTAILSLGEYRIVDIVGYENEIQEIINMTEDEKFLDFIKEYEESIVGIYKEGITEPETVFDKALKEYPAGMAMLFREMAEIQSMGEIYVISLIMGIVIGTAIYLMLDKDKKGLKFVITLYILFVLVLGFVEGIGSVAGENLTLLDRWVFPEIYIIPVTAAFALEVIVRVIKQKEIAKKLNEKLKEKKKKINKKLTTDFYYQWLIFIL